MTNSQWIDEWMRAWQSFGSEGANPWTAAFDHFTRSNQAAYQQQFSGALARISEQSRAFFDLGQTLAQNDGGDWRESVFKYLDALSELTRDPHTALQAFAGASPLDYWRRFAGHEAQPPRDPPSLVSQVEKLLEMPGLGYTREHQESLQELSRLWLHYERAYGEYAAYCAETARRSVDALRERLAEEFGSGRGPASIRELYDAWVACSEDVYAERAATEDYMKLHSGMVNALMAYRRQAGRLLDQWVEAANLPSREEVDALHRKLKDTRRELRELKAGLGTGRPTRK